MSEVKNPPQRNSIFDPAELPLFLLDGQMFVTVAQKLRFASFLIVALIVGNLVTTLFFSYSTQSAARQVRDVDIQFALLAKQMQQSTIQVQQWLTDISATRAAKGFDDGYAEAENHAIAFRKSLKEFREAFVAAKNEKGIATIDEIENAFEEYYKTGKEMAAAYIAQGPDGGNPLMEKFDPAAERINACIDELVQSHETSLRSGIDLVVGKALLQIRFGWAFCIIGIMISLFGNLFLKRSVLQPLERTTAALREISQGSGDLSCRLESNRDDEFGALARHFNDFVSQIQNIVASIVLQSHRLAGSSNILQQVAIQNAASSDQLRERSQSMSSAANRLDSKMTQSSTFTDRLSSSTNEIANAIGELTHCIADIAKGAERAAGVADHTAKLASSADETIATLDVAAGEIGRVIDVIQEIAEQNESPRLERNDRSSASWRCRTRLCRGGNGSQIACQTDGRCHRRHPFSNRWNSIHLQRGCSRHPRYHFCHPSSQPRIAHDRRGC